MSTLDLLWVSNFSDEWGFSCKYTILKVSVSVHNLEKLTLN